MSQPIPSPASASAEAAGPPPGSVFSPPPAAPPAPPREAVPDPAVSAYKEQAYAVLGHHHGIQGRLDALARRLSDLLEAHGALVAHITAQAPAASTSTPGGTAFWGQALDQHHIIHGMIKAAEAEAAKLLAAHGGVIGVLETLL